MLNQEKSQDSKKRKGAPLWFIILFIIILVIGIGYGFAHPNTYKKSLVLTFDPVPAGAPLKYDFAPELIFLLNSQATTTATSTVIQKGSKKSAYSFYLNSEIGSLPTGLKLGADGVLSGTPTESEDSEFEICIKDVNGVSACRIYVMPVAPKAAVTPKPSKTPVPAIRTTPASTPITSICPANSHSNPSDSNKCLCDAGYQFNSAGNSCEPKTEYCPTAVEMGCGSVVPDGMGGGLGLEAAFQPASCGCPSGTVHDSSYDQKNVYGETAYYCKCIYK